ncbi:MAG: ATP-dependent DNA ligase, partial [Patescibacteria group bacterium]
MTFADFSNHLSKIEATPKRLEITDLLAELIKQTDPEEVEKAVNLSLGQLAPLYKDIDFNMAEKMMVKAVAKATGEEEPKVDIEFKRIGDLGETVMSLSCKAGSRFAGRVHPRIAINEVFEILLEIAMDFGENSQERKIENTANLLRGIDPLSAKYAVRIILGNLRLGFSDRTVLDALSKLVAGDKSARKKLEEIYNVRPDIGWMAKTIQDSRFKIQDFRTDPQLGIPILPSLCQRLEGTEEIVEKMGTVAAEPKWDGQRIQAHINLKGKPKIQLFTRGLENVAPMFPDLVSALSRFTIYDLRFTNCILDGEVVAFDSKTNKILPFQTMITRKRKYDIQQQLLNVPIRYMIFDIMYLDGKSLMNEPFSNRRQALERIFSLSNLSNHSLSLAPQLVSNNPLRIRDFLKKQIDSGLEGIVTKRLDSPYSPGRTGFSWVKLKWEGKAKSGGLVDTIDCVVMGIYAGQGKRAGFGVGAFLAGIYSPSNSSLSSNSSFLTISKIGTGLTDEQWRELKIKSEKLKVKSCPKEYDVPKALNPDIWIEPKIVVEIQADNITVSPLHTAGFALRFPRLVRYRDDKSPQQITTV